MDGINQVLESWISYLPSDMGNYDLENNAFYLRIINIMSKVMTQRRMSTELDTKLSQTINKIIGKSFSIDLVQ